MNEQHAKVIIETLCCWFEVRQPKLSWSNRAKRGRYRPSKKLVVCGPKCWRGPLSSLLHEFAHYLTDARSGFRRINVTNFYSSKMPRRNDEHHGPAFHRALTDTAEAWFGNAKLYEWDTEYRSLKCGPRPPIDF